MITKDDIIEAVERLQPNAYSRSILSYLREHNGEEPPLITVYNQLDHLEDEGLVIPRLGPRGDNHQRIIFYDLRTT